MRHRSVRRRLSLYLDGELGVRQRRRIESHLAECDDCGRVFRTLFALVAHLETLRGSPDGPVADRIVTRLRRDAD